MRMRAERVHEHQRAENAVLLRAAEETLGHGRMDFQVMDPGSVITNRKIFGGGTAFLRRSTTTLVLEKSSSA